MAATSSQAERKVATVLFADVVGSTGLGEALDVEPLQEIMAAFHRASVSAIEDFGGGADISGDAVIGAFGVPVAVEDHVGRALRAAALIVERVRILDHDLGPLVGCSLAVRIGINTGPVLVPAGAADLSALMGDTWNVAARLQHQALPGEVVVGARTAHAARGWEFEDRGFVRLQGRSEPVRVFRLRSPTPVRRAVAPLMGRQEIVSELAGLVSTPGGPPIALLVGEAGIGKTRVLEAVASALDDPPETVVVTTACPPFGGEGALAPLASLVALAGEPTGEAGQMGETVMRTAGLLPASGGEPAGPGTARAEVRAAWSDFVALLCRDRSLVVVVDDLHWAEPELVDLLGVLAGRPAVSARFVASARPEFLDEYPEWGTLDLVAQVVLPPLDPVESEGLAGWLLDDLGLDEREAADLAVLAEGNPFFLTELARAASEGSEIETGPASLPDTVQAVLAQRIDRLGEWEKRVLQAASVVGRTFWPGALRAALDADPGPLDSALRLLEERRFVVRSERGPGSETEFVFDHALTMDVAYASVPRRRLHDLHDRIADWLEHAEVASTAVLVAHHRLAAYETAAADWTLGDEARMSLRCRARERALDAGRHALGRAATGAAKRWGGHALGLSDSDPDRVDALEVLGNAHFHDYEGDEAWELLVEAIDLALATGCRTGPAMAGLCARALDSPIRWPGGMRELPAVERLVHYMDLGFAHLPEGPSVERVRLLTLRGFWPYAAAARVGGQSPIPTAVSEEAAATAADMAEGLDRPDLESAALDGLASIYITAGDYGRAVEVTTRRLGLVERIDSAWERGDMCAVGAWTLHHAGRLREAERWATRGIEWTLGEYPMVALHCLNWRGVTRFRLGDWEGLLTDLGRARDLLGGTAGTPPPYVGPLFAATAAVCDLRGRREEADELMSTLSALHAAADVGDRDVGPLARWAEYLGPVVARRGRVEEAMSMIDATRWRRPSRLGHLLAARCQIVGDAGMWAEAPDLVEESLAVARERGLAALEGSGWLLDGRHRLSTGDPARALDSLRRAEETFELTGSALELARAERWTAAALHLLDRHAEAEAHEERAGRVLATLGVGLEAVAALASR